MSTKRTKKPASTSGKKTRRTPTSRRSRDAGSPVDTVRVESWDEYLSWVTRYPFPGWAFRGHADADWPLTSTLTRTLIERRIKPTLWEAQEERSLRIFKRKAHHFLERTPEEDEEFEWLALMQHHGAPTRLLDFTWSPYVAAFFALESGTKDAAIWAIDPRTLGFIATKDVRGPLAKKRRVLVGEPRLMNQRLTAQSGTFAVPWRLHTPVDEQLRRQHRGVRVIARFILPRTTIRDTALRELYRMNISYATLFPGLDGLAQSMRQELEYTAQMERPDELKMS